MDLPDQAGYARITTKEECKKASSQLGVSPYSNFMMVEKVTDKPPFCYLEAARGYGGQVLKERKSIPMLKILPKILPSFETCFNFRLPY